MPLPLATSPSQPPENVSDMMNRKNRSALALLTVTALAACGDSGTDIIGGDLTQTEAEELGGVVLTAVFSTSGSVPSPASAPMGPQLTPFTFAAQIDDVFPCQGGGTVDVAAQIEISGDDTQPEAASMEYQMTQIHSDCIVTSENGNTFTLNGNPSMNVAFSVNVDGQGTAEWGGSIQGNVEWVTASRSGSCFVELEFAGTAQGSGATTAEMTGSVCEFSIDHAFSVG